MTSTGGRLGLSAVVAVVFALQTACNRCNRAPEPAASESATLPQPAPVPRDLLFDVLVPRPARTWHLVRELVGSSARLLPLNVGLMATRLLGLGPALAGRIDADLPWVGAVVSSKEGTWDWVLAMHVQSGAELVAELTQGKTPSHRAKPSGAVTILERTEPGSGWSLAVVDNYLVAGGDASVLKVAAPYAARTLSQRKMPSESVVMVAERHQLRDAAVDLLREAWTDYRRDLDAKRENAQRAHGGRAPDFAEPAAVVGALDSWVEELASYARSSERLEIALSAQQTHATLVVELFPQKSGTASSWVDRLAVGKPSRLLLLPATTAVALFTKSTQSERTEGAKSVRAGLQELLGARLSDQDGEVVSEVFEGLAKGRGDELSMGFSSTPKPALLVSGSVSDPLAMSKALAKLPALLRLPAVADPLESFVGRPKVLTLAAPPGARGVRVELAPGQAAGEAIRWEALWSADGDGYRWVCGPAPAKELMQLLREPAATLKSSADLERRLANIDAASAVLLVSPARLGLLAGAPADQMVSLVAGRQAERARLELQVPAGVLRSALASGFEP